MILVVIIINYENSLFRFAESEKVRLTQLRSTGFRNPFANQLPLSKLHFASLNFLRGQKIFVTIQVFASIPEVHYLASQSRFSAPSTALAILRLRFLINPISVIASNY
jgi:hypothetical protein